MSNEVLLIGDCREIDESCDAPTTTINNMRTATLHLRNVGSMGSPLPQFDHDASSLTDVTGAVFFADSSTNQVFLVIERVYTGFTLVLAPQSSAYVSISVAGTTTTYAFTVPSTGEPSFSWEIEATQPGIPLKVTVKRK
ncbi:hypothetical protein [Paraliomyxa miuraensis]|uniref:hypothetical protein n=1 Tax=Paraliomyxa miuraensis TaxID=376150 RepID=UPI002251543C|nr:hypothetical protein [Paraliomyxa miuraensis]MCX4240849.1 hypothetical protein [Paraliomyxa miuraensis]